MFAPEAEQLRSLQRERRDAAEELICYTCRALAECLQPADRELQRLAEAWGDGRLPTAGPIEPGRSALHRSRTLRPLQSQRLTTAFIDTINLTLPETDRSMTDRTARALATLRATYSRYTVAEMMVVFHRLVHEKADDDGPDWTYWGAARGAIVELGVLDKPAALHVGQESVDLPIPAEQWCRVRQIDGTYVSSRHNRTEPEARDHELQNNEHYLARGGTLDNKGRAPESARLETEDLLVLLAADTETRRKSLRGDRSAALAERRAERRYRMGS